MTEKTAAPTIEAAPRKVFGKKVKSLRKDGYLPVVIYGHNKETQALSVNELEFKKVYAETGHSTLLNVKIEDHKPVKVLIHDVQQDPVRGSILHVDFYQVNLKEKLRTPVPLEFFGTSEAVEMLGGTIIEVKSEVEVECLPEDLIHNIQVDVSILKTFEDTIRVGDLKVPERSTIIDDADEVIASISKPLTEEELAELEAPVEEVVEEVESDTTSGTDTEEAETETNKEE